MIHCLNIEHFFNLIITRINFETHCLIIGHSSWYEFYILQVNCPQPPATAILKGYKIPDFKLNGNDTQIGMACVMTGYDSNNCNIIVAYAKLLRTTLPMSVWSLSRKVQPFSAYENNNNITNHRWLFVYKFLSLASDFCFITGNKFWQVTSYYEWVF